MIINRMLCCGWKEISSLSVGAVSLKGLLQALIDGNAYVDNRLRQGGFLFTANVEKPNYASRLAKLIAKHELGEVVELPSFINPNTSHPINTYVWIPDAPALKRAILKQYPKGLPRNIGW